MPPTLRLNLLLGFALLLAPAAGRAQPAADAPARPPVDPAALEYRTDWYGVYMRGPTGTDKIGYVRTQRARLADGAVRDETEMHMKIVSFGQKAEVHMAQAFVYDAAAPHRLRRGELTMSDGMTKKRTAVERTAAGLQLRETVGDTTVARPLEGDYDLADAVAAEAWLRAGPAVGDKLSARHLELSEGKFDTQTSTARAVKQSLAKGVKVRFFEVETVSANTGLKSLSRHDDKGLMLSDQVAGIFELRLEPEEKAKDTRFSQDLFVMGMAKIDRPVGEPKTVTELVVEVAAKEAEGFADGPRQSVTAAGKGRLLKLGKAHGKPAPATAAEVKEALASTVAYPLDHPKVKALAEKAVGDAREPREKVRRIVDFVHGFVRPSLSANVPTIHGLLEHKKGDCKSYALLTTALCRAAGVPAREVSGLLYVGDDLKAFGGHAWNEVVLDGQWVPVDASLNEPEVDATHICFGAEHRATQNLLNTLGKLSFRLVEVKHAQP